MVQARRVEKFLPKSWWHAYFDVFCWMYWDMLKSAFRGIEKILSGKNFAQNERAPRICVEEILWSILQDESVSDFDSMMVLLNFLAKKSRTVDLWLKAVIWPVILIIRFVRASREEDWTLHIHTVKLMLPYFTAAGHWHYLRCASVCLMKMTKLPKNLLKNFLDGEHATRHQNGIWNSIWLDMVIETTVMRYGHGLNGIRFNEKVLDHWAKRLHISSIVEKNPA